MIDLVLPSVVSADDGRLGWPSHPEAPGACRWNALAHDLGLAEGAARQAFDADPQALRRRATGSGGLPTLRFAACVGEALLEAAVDLARSRKSQDKILLTFQAVALRIANLYLAVQCIDQGVDAQAHEGGGTPPARRRHAADQLLAALRHAAQVMAGHGYVDNEAFAALHQVALDTVRDLGAPETADA